MEVDNPVSCHASSLGISLDDFGACLEMFRLSTLRHVVVYAETGRVFSHNGGATPALMCFPCSFSALCGVHEEGG